jgi:hypothetical protein
VLEFTLQLGVNKLALTGTGKKVLNDVQGDMPVGIGGTGMKLYGKNLCTLVVVGVCDAGGYNR